MMQHPYKILLVFFLIIFFITSVQAQNQNKIDSLLRELKTVKEDTTRLVILDKLSWQFIGAGDYAEGLKYATEKKMLAEKLISETSDSKVLVVLKKKLAGAYRSSGRANVGQGD